MMEGSHSGGVHLVLGLVLMHLSIWSVLSAQLGDILEGLARSLECLFSPVP